ncbi:MAG TPA: hypothetical protein VGN44_17465, partial [Candidatus Angelobacter sp.]
RHSGFQDHLFQPLTHLSAGASSPHYCTMTCCLLSAAIGSSAQAFPQFKILSRLLDSPFEPRASKKK